MDQREPRQTGGSGSPVVVGPRAVPLWFEGIVFPAAEGIAGGGLLWLRFEAVILEVAWSVVVVTVMIRALTTRVVIRPRGDPADWIRGPQHPAFKVHPLE